jgi:hypothetical protein
MFKAIKEFFFGKPAEQTATPVAPYKVETPVTVSTVVVDASLDNKPQVIAVAVESVAATPSVKKSAPPRAKKPAVAKPAAKPAVAKPAAKKPAAPRKPRTPAA